MCKMLNTGTVPAFKKLNVGTDPMLKIVPKKLRGHQPCHKNCTHSRAVFSTILSITLIHKKTLNYIQMKCSKSKEYSYS